MAAINPSTERVLIFMFVAFHSVFRLTTIMVPATQPPVPIFHIPYIKHYCSCYPYPQTRFAAAKYYMYYQYLTCYYHAMQCLVSHIIGRYT